MKIKTLSHNNIKVNKVNVEYHVMAKVQFFLLIWYTNYEIRKKKKKCLLLGRGQVLKVQETPLFLSVHSKTKLGFINYRGNIYTYW